jgi:O-antigen ligase
VLALAFAMLILAQSRTSLVGFFVAVAVQLLFARRFRLLALAAVVATLVVASGDIANIAERFFVRGQSQELFSSLSGRTLAWRAAWEAFQESPILGHGFAAAARAEILGATGASTLHGAVFDVLVGVGLLGMVPWAMAIAWTSVRLLRLGIGGRIQSEAGAADGGTIAEMLGVLALIIVRSTTSSGLALHEHEFMVFCTVLAFTMTATPSRRETRVAAPGTGALRHQAVRNGERANAKHPLRPPAPAARRRSV